MPRLLTINNAINHPNWLFLPAFHNDMPFQITSQITNETKITITKGAIVSSGEE